MTQLQDLSTRLMGEIGFESLLDEVSAATIALLKADFATIELCDPASGRLTLVAQHGPMQPSTEYVRRMHVASDREDSLRRRMRVLVRGESLVDRLDTPDTAGSGVRLSTPLFGPGGRPLGVISAHFLKPTGPAARELQFFALYSRHAASVIERERSWQTLRASEERLRRYFDLGLIGTAVITPAKQILEANDELCRILGYDRHEMVGLGWAEVTEPDDWPAEAGQLERALAGEIDRYSIDKRWIRKDRRIVYTSVAAQCMRCPDGSADYLLAVVQDITERKLAEDRLRQEAQASRDARDEFTARREAYLAEAERMSHTGSWALNALTGELFWSEEHFRICGVDPAHFRLTLESGQQLIHPDDRAFVGDLLARSIAERAHFECDCRVLRPSGEARFIHSRARPVFNDLGSLIGYVGSIIDATEIRHADEERMRLVRRAMAAQEDERRRIAREMHDQCGERLAELSACIGSIRAQCDGSPPVCRELDALEATAGQLDSDLTFLIWALRPTALDDLGLVAALRAYSLAWSKRYAVTAQVHCTGLEGSRLSPESETALYRIMQEALTNVAKHAHASHVSVILERRSDVARLIIEDDGIGFDVVLAGADGADPCGLVGMRERAALLGGTLDIESSATRGTTLITRIPCSGATRPPGGDE
ncbi:MAG TPA: PAS domain-containing protein [Steroidobacteraceae bacterium]|nr:PAS domain-containing protein [Steroidobacteraceae bacterium]